MKDKKSHFAIALSAALLMVVAMPLGVANGDLMDPPSHIIEGTVTFDGNDVSGIVVSVTNLETSETLSDATDSNSEYEIDLGDYLNGYSAGDRLDVIFYYVDASGDPFEEQSCEEVDESSPQTVNAALQSEYDRMLGKACIWNGQLNVEKDENLGYAYTASSSITFKVRYAQHETRQGDGTDHTMDWEVYFEATPQTQGTSNTWSDTEDDGQYIYYGGSNDYHADPYLTITINKPTSQTPTELWDLDWKGSLSIDEGEPIVERIDDVSVTITWT